MQNLKITELPPASLPITTGVKFEAVQAGINVQVDADNMPGSGGGAWGTITGTLSAQTDLQAALDLKSDKIPNINTETVDYTLVLTDEFVSMDKATAVNLTVPPNSSVAFPLNKYIPVLQAGIGTVNFVAGVGVTITSSSGNLTTPSQNSIVGLIQTGIDDWQLINGSLGDIIDWSTGITPVGWASFTTKQAYYIDDGRRVFLTGQISGTGDSGTTASFSLPVAANSTVYATAAGVFVCQTVSSGTVAAGIAAISGGSVTCTIFPTVTGSTGWSANNARQIRFSFTYFK